MSLAVEFVAKPRGYGFRILSGSEILVEDDYMGKIHGRVAYAGALAGLPDSGLSILDNPYRRDKISHGRVQLGRRGFRNAWQRGFEAMQQARKETERHPTT